METAIKELSPQIQVDVEWRAFELRPIGSDLPPLPEDYLQRAWVNIHRLNREFNMPLMQRNSHPDAPSRLALEGQKYAIERGQAKAYTDRLFQAVFYNDEDISQMETLRQAAVEVGLDPDDFQARVESGEYAPAVDEDIALARQWGISSVPCYVVGRQGLAGVQRPEALKQLIQSGEHA